MSIKYELRDAVATITLDDGKVNVLGIDVIRQLNDALIRADIESSSVVLCGRKGFFSAGFDLNVLKEGGPESIRLVNLGFELSYRILSYPKPLVIACTGHALAMGVFLLLSGDLRLGVAGAEHRISANEVAIGMTMPRTAIEICRQRVPVTHLNRVVVAAEIFTPDEAVIAGLLDRVVPSDSLLTEAHNAALRMATLDAAAFSATKLRVRDHTLNRLSEAMTKDLEDFTNRNLL